MSNDIHRTIRIWDKDSIDLIAKIQELPQYKSANLVINDALMRGLPILYKELFGGEEESEEEWEPPAFPEEPTQQPPMCPDREFCWTATLLLKEINLNELLNKQMLSGIFRFLALIAEGTTGEEFAKLLTAGKLGLTPDCLTKQEAEGLKAISKLGDRSRNDQ